jgi:hypothetical protein
MHILEEIRADAGISHDMTRLQLRLIEPIPRQCPLLTQSGQYLFMTYSEYSQRPTSLDLSIHDIVRAITAEETENEQRAEK